MARKRLLRLVRLFSGAALRRSAVQIRARRDDCHFPKEEFDDPKLAETAGFR